MPETQGELSYRLHPARHDPGRGMVVLAMVFLTAWGAAATTGSLYFGLLSVVVLGAGLARFFFPTDYSLTSEGITIRTWLHRQQRAWSDFRRFRIDGDSVVLLTRSRRSRLDHYRGLTLPCGPRRQEVIDVVTARIGSTAGEHAAA